MKDLKVIRIADDGLISFAWTGEEVSGFELLLQQLCVSILSNTRNFPWGTFVGGDVSDMATYTDNSEFSAELSSRLEAICKQIQETHPDFHGATLEGAEVIGNTMRATIAVATDYGRRYIKLPIGA